MRVANVLEGSVRKAGNQLRITVQLIRADNGYHLWSETYDRDAKDIFKVQDEITSAVVGALRLTLLPTKQEADANRSSNADAYDQYLRGMHYEHLGDLESERLALQAYNAAIALDPRYASAYAGLSFTESEIADFTADQAGYARAQAAAEKALALSPHLTQGYRARANVRLRQLDLAGARADVEMALALSPGNGKVQDDYGNVLATFGRLSEAAAALNKATELEPQFAVAWMDLGALLCGLHRLTEARRAGDTAVSLAPGDPGGHAVLGTVNFFEGRFQDAQGEFQKIGEGAGLAGVALAEHGLGHEAQSQRALQVLIAKHAADAAFQIAEVYAVRSEKNKAIEWLERAYHQRDPGILSITYDPYLDNLREEPRYMALLRGMHLSE